MKPEVFVYDGDALTATAERVLESLSDRSSVRIVDVSAGPDARRTGTLAIKEAVRIGRPPAALYDDGLDPAPGALVMVADTGRKTLFVGEEAVDALGEAGYT